MTTLKFGPDPKNKHVTTYFRHAFDVADAKAVKDLLLELVYDNQEFAARRESVSMAD